MCNRYGMPPYEPCCSHRFCCHHPHTNPDGLHKSRCQCCKNNQRKTSELIKRDENICITHPFSPLRKHSFQLIQGKNFVWGEDRLLCMDENGFYRRILTSWTNYEPPTPFIEVSQGRAYLTDKSLLDLASLLTNLLDEVSS